MGNTKLFNPLLWHLRMHWRKRMLRKSSTSPTMLLTTLHWKKRMLRKASTPSTMLTVLPRQRRAMLLPLPSSLPLSSYFSSLLLQYLLCTNATPKILAPVTNLTLFPTHFTLAAVTAAAAQVLLTRTSPSRLLQPRPAVVVAAAAV